MSSTINSFFSELELFGVKLGLEQTEKLFCLIGNPHEKLKFIHIAGTNGKGSVGAMLSGALSEVGFKIGFYSSPHLISIRERFRINGKAISEKRLEKLISEIKPHICEIRKNGLSPTYFEVTTALAAKYFEKENCDYVIWETGMGGRFDATNIVTPELSVITGIGLDHSAYLGETLEKIAFEKAGIIKNRVPVFCGELDERSKKVILAKAAEEKAICSFASESDEFCFPNFQLKGNYQKKNAKLAVNILKYLTGKLDFDLEESFKGIEKIRWPGRLQIIDERIIIDGAHNTDAVESLMESLFQLFPNRKYSIIFASLCDKDTINILSQLATIAEEFIFPQIKCSRKMVDPEELMRMSEKFKGIKLKKSTNFHEALISAGKEDILITGSLYLAGEALKELIEPEKILNI